MTILVATGMGNLYIETDSFELWVPTNMDAYNNMKHITSNFLDSNRGAIMLYMAKDGGNVLRSEYLEEALALHKNFTTDTESPDGLRYHEICHRVSPELSCDFTNMLMVFNYDIATFKAIDASGGRMTSINNLETVNQIPMQIFLGGIERDTTSSAVPPPIVSAKVLRMVYPMSSSNTTDPFREEIIDLVNNYEDAIQDKFYWKWNKDSSKIGTTKMITQKSVDDEIGRLIEVDSKLFGGSIFMIVLVLCLTFVKPSISSPDLVKSRFVAGLSAIVIIIFSILFAFGFMGSAGIPMNSICLMICFVVAGVGVDDMIVIENFYQKALDANLPKGERMSYALKHGGLSVFLTSASSIFAFASGTR